MLSCCESTKEDMDVELFACLQNGFSSIVLFQNVRLTQASSVL